MVVWPFFFTEEAREDVARLDSSVRKRILEKLAWFSEHFDEMEPVPLGMPWAGSFKLRVGDWRVVYDVNHASRRLIIHMVDRRDKVYKRTPPRA